MSPKAWIYVGAGVFFVATLFSCVMLLSTGVRNTEPDLFSEACALSGTLVVTGFAGDADGTPLRNVSLLVQTTGPGCPASYWGEILVRSNGDGLFESVGPLFGSDGDVLVTITTPEGRACQLRYDASETQSTRMELTISVGEGLDVRGRAAHYHAESVLPDPNYERELPECESV